MNPAYLVPILGTLSFFTPCMWNVNLLFRAYTKGGDLKQIPILLVSRLALFNFIALVFFLVSKKITISVNVLLTVQGIVAGIFLLGFPLMRRIGIAPFDLSPQFFFPDRRFPPGVGLGLSLPYCALPFVALLGVYSLHFKNPFLLFNLYALIVTLPTVLLLFLPEKVLRTLTSFIPAVPAFTGFLLILAIGWFVDISSLTIYISSLLQESHSFFFLIPVMFVLGFFTSLGPSTLPFLPIVFGLIVTRHKRVIDLVLSIGGFFTAFLLTHALTGGIVSLTTVFLSDIFRTDIFNLLLAGLLLAIALNLLNLFPFSLEIARIGSLFSSGTSSLLIGIAYTFSLCPSCTSLLLGAVVLSTSTGSVSQAVFLMMIYAVGRSVPIFLSGIVATSLSDFFRRNYVVVNRVVGMVFLVLSGYFFKNFLEVVL